MLLTSQNRNSAILQNIMATLAQIKVSGITNKSIAIDKAAATPTDSFNALTSSQFESMALLDFESLATSGVAYTVSFYLDPGHSILLFSDTSASSPSKFTSMAGQVFYTPTDTGLNDATSVSTTKNQATYCLVVTSTAGLNRNLVYNNFVNLLFANVIAATKGNPKFTTNTNQVIVVPTNERQINKYVSGLHGHMIYSFDLYVQMIIPNWENLSEANRISAQQAAANQIRNALYQDRYRNSTCTLMDAQLNGTMVKSFKPLASDAVLRGVMQVDTVTWTDGDSNF